MSAPVRPGSVVVGVDGSPASDAALEWATDFATARHLPLCILHGAGDLGDNLIPFKEDAREMLSRASRRITDHALEIVTRRAPDLDVEIHTRFEDARQALLDVDQASMVVLGTRGRGPIKSLLLGSVSQAVASHSSYPVTLVRPTEGRDDGGSPAPVVVGVDLDRTADAALEVGFQIASMSHRPLMAIHASAAEDNVIAQLTQEQRDVVTGKHERGFAEAMSGYAEKYPDVTVTTRMTDQAAPAALVSASEQAAHVIVGGRAVRRVPRYFGSIGRAVVEHAHCPVTVVRPTVHGYTQEQTITTTRS
jgi:nucleotide-binding universal stress UspA family protein